MVLVEVTYPGAFFSKLSLEEGYSSNEDFTGSYIYLVLQDINKRS